MNTTLPTILSGRHVAPAGHAPLVVDLRSAAERAAGPVIAGSMHVPLPPPPVPAALLDQATERIAAAAQRVGAGRVVVHCHEAIRSAQVVERLRRRGVEAFDAGAMSDPASLATELARAVPARPGTAGGSARGGGGAGWLWWGAGGAAVVIVLWLLLRRPAGISEEEFNRLWVELDDATVSAAAVYGADPDDYLERPWEVDHPTVRRLWTAITDPRNVTHLRTRMAMPVLPELTRALTRRALAEAQDRAAAAASAAPPRGAALAAAVGGGMTRPRLSGPTP